LGASRAQAFVAAGSFAAFTAALTLPSRWLTGRWVPSALGARVEIPALVRPDHWLDNIAAALRDGYALNPWVAASLALAVVAGILPSGRDRPAVRGAAAALAGYFVFRAALGLVDFNVGDRYVSFLWPLYVIIALSLATRARIWGAVVRRVGNGRARRLAIAVVGVACALAGLRAERELAADTEEMNQVVVAPALWMSENLPPGSRVAMEPAGAIRVFTDLYLIDNTGLTTGHRDEFRALGIPQTFVAYVAHNRVSHVFDYPGRLPDLNRSDSFRLLRAWTPQPIRHSLGTIAVFRVLLPTAPPPPG
jgi:hypothetical protein